MTTSQTPTFADGYDQVIMFYAAIRKESFGALGSALSKAIADRCQNVLLVIKSPGGDTGVSLDAFALVQTSPLQVDTCALSSVDSGAVFLYCAGHRRFILPWSLFLLHPPATSAERTTLDDIPNKKRVLEKHAQSALNILLSACVGTPTSEVKKWFKRETVLDADLAIRYGLAHEVVSSPFPSDPNRFTFIDKPD